MQLLLKLELTFSITFFYGIVSASTVERIESVLLIIHGALLIGNVRSGERKVLRNVDGKSIDVRTRMVFVILFSFQDQQRFNLYAHIFSIWKSIESLAAFFLPCFIHIAPTEFHSTLNKNCYRSN